MELIFPSVLGLVIAAIVVMYLLPRLSPLILGVIALFLLVVSAKHHYSFFYNEYQQSTWQSGYVAYSPYIIIGGLVVFLIFFIINFIGIGSAASAAPIANINTAMNRVANQMPTTEGIANTITNGITNVVNTVKNAVGVKTNNAQQQQQLRFSQV